MADWISLVICFGLFLCSVVMLNPLGATGWFIAGLFQFILMAHDRTEAPRG